MVVVPDVEAGRRLVEALSHAGVPVEAAFWALEEESGEWRLFLASPRFDAVGPTNAYLLIQQHLTGDQDLSLSEVKVINPSERKSVLVPGMSRVTALKPNTLLRDVYIGQTYFPGMYIYLLPAFA